MKERIQFNAIGDIVDVRTYRRWLPTESRRETAKESFDRVVNYSVNLSSGLESEEDIERERALMTEKIYALKILPSNRARWAAGTSTIDKNALCAFNCSFIVINRLTAFTELFEALMLGTGVGFRVFERDINQLPKLSTVRHNYELEFKPYNDLSSDKRVEHTYTNYHQADNGDNIMEIVVGDSKRGWVDAVGELINLAHNTNKKVDRVIYNMNSIRPEGERLVTFGGRASGPKPLIQAIKNISDVLKEVPTSSERLRSIDCMDISCAIAQAVVVASIRRSSLICLFDHGDTLCSTAKKDLFTDPILNSKKIYRVQSNNTECMGSKGWEELVQYLENNRDCTKEDVLPIFNKYAPSKAEINDCMKSIEVNGEPGIEHYLFMVWKKFEAVRQWRDSSTNLRDYLDVGSNPCHEIILSAGVNGGKGGGVCNLSTQAIPKFVRGEDDIDLEDLEICTRLITRIGVRQTLVSLPWKDWDDTQKAERLLGVSLTGWQDAMSLLNWNTNGEKASRVRKAIREWANDEATNYSQKLGIPRPLLVTTVKPEGTASLVLSCSSGLHWDWASHYFRRMRISGKDALALTLRDMGYNIYPEITAKNINESLASCDSIDIKDLDSKSVFDKIELYESLSLEERKIVLDNSDTWVIDFPMVSPTKVSAGSVDAITQLENLRNFSVEYTDHTPSVTISVKSSEWEQVANWLYQNWNEGFITAAFLAYFESTYPLLPIQVSTEGKVMEALANLPQSNIEYLDDGKYRFKVDYDLLSKYEKQLDMEGTDVEELTLSVSSCETGMCPVR